MLHSLQRPTTRHTLAIATIALSLTLGLAPGARAQDQALELRNQSASPFAQARIADSPTLEWQAFTIEAWITPMGPGVGSGPRIVVAKASEGGVGSWLSSYALAWLPNGSVFGQVSFSLGVIGVEAATAPNTVPVGTSAFVALSFDGNALRIWVDGLLAAELVVGPSTVVYGSQDVLFGAGNFASSADRFDGVIDEVRLWNSALSPGTIALHAHCALASPNEPGLVSRWSFDGGDVTDSTGHGGDGVLEGTEWSFVPDLQPLGPPCPQLGLNYCSPAVTNSSGAPGTIGAYGSSVVADDNFLLLAGSLPTGQFGYFLASRTEGALNPPGSLGLICLSGNIGRYNQSANIIQGPTGTLEVDLSAIPVNPPAAVAPGESWYFQCWYRDIGPTNNFTDAVVVFFQ